MCAKSALRAGAGLVTAFSPAAVQPIIASYGPEIMTAIVDGDSNFFSAQAITQALELIKDKSVVALGPGIGTDEQTAAFVKDFVQQIEIPLVIDADGLNLVASNRSALLKRKPGSTVLTPHPGEMARLLNTDTKTIQSDRLGAASKLSQETGAIVVLKGYRTIIADTEQHMWINPTGGPALASGGTGDILTGVISSFIAQNVPVLQAAIAGVYVHGLTANLFEKEFPQQALNAMDILSLWNKAVHIIRTEKTFESEYLNFHFAF
jgi:NAD(P)H-hydrate epimerase